MKIGFIGLGIMGSRMVANLLNAGHDLVVHNRSKDKAFDIIANGAVWADSPKELAESDVDIVITMLAHPEAVEAVVLGDDGLLASMKDGALWIDSSTVHPNFSRRMAAVAMAYKVRFLDAPVTGTKKPAELAQLVFFVGGDAVDVELVTPVFDVMGAKTVHLGEHGMGTSLKMVVNYMLASSMAAFSEGIVFGQKLGLSESALMNTLVGGPLVPAYLGLKQDALENDAYTASFPLKWIQKDMQMVSNAAYDVGTAMPLANMVKELYQMSVEAGLGDEDFSAIYKSMKIRAGL